MGGDGVLPGRIAHCPLPFSHSRARISPWASPHPFALPLRAMSLLSRRKRGVTAGVEVVLQAIKEAGDVFPPVKSAAAAVIVLWEMSRVSARLYEIAVSKLTIFSRCRKRSRTVRIASTLQIERQRWCMTFGLRRSTIMQEIFLRRSN
jgi:hypothetical protein